MAYLRDRRAFGNIGTRKFRGARFGDPLSPRGPQYTKEGRVLDYSTDVGPFTIVDQSGESNTATLYSGRGLTMDGVGDLIDFGSPTFSEPVTRMTGLARSTDTSIDLGLTSTTLAGNDTWETFSADTATNANGDARWFNGVDSKVAFGDTQDEDGSTAFFIEATILPASVLLSSIVDKQAAAPNYQGYAFRVIGGELQLTMGSSGANRITVVTAGANLNDGAVHVCRVTYDGSKSGSGVSFLVDGVSQSVSITVDAFTGNSAATGINLAIGSRDIDGAVPFKGTIYAVNINDQLAVTGIGAISAWLDTIGIFNGSPTNITQSVTQYFTNPDFILGTGYNGDLSDVRCLGATGTVLGHWSLADWSDPTGDTSNGKTIVDSGPNQLHGTCTGCSGFTGEGIDPDFAGIVGYDDAQWFNGTNAHVELDSQIDIVGDFSISFDFLTNLNATNQGVISDGSNTNRIATSAYNNFRIDISGTGSAFTDYTVPVGELISVELVRVATTATLFVDGNDVGSVTVGGGTFSLTKIGKLNTGYMGGLIFNININDQAEYTGRGATPWNDTIGSNDGTPSGTFVSVGQKRATIPQTADKNWNKYQWFNGTDASVSVAGMTSAVDYFGGCTISAWIYVADAATTQTVWSLGSSSYRLIAVGGQWRLNSLGDTSVSVVEGWQKVSAEYASSGDGISLSINDTEVWAGTPAVGATPSTIFYIGARYSTTTGLFFSGLISEFTITGSSVKNFAYTGLGNDPWKDTIGSNDGTEAGTFTRELVSASDANIQIDALGTAISEPRLNTQQLNLFGEGEYSLTPDSASLDLTTAGTWEVWGNFYGVPATIGALIGKYDSSSSGRSFLLTKHTDDNADQVRVISSSDGVNPLVAHVNGATDSVSCLTVTHDGATWVAYLNGVAASLTGTLHASLKVNNVPVEIGFNAGSSLPYSGKIGSAKIYNVALTADEVLTNYNTQKSLYGL